MLLLYKKTWLISIVLAMMLPAVSSAQGGIVNESGTHLVANGTVHLIINNGGVKNDGTFTAANSTLSFTGNTGTMNSFISGGSAVNLYNLTLNKSANGLQLNRNIGVSNTLLFTSGDSLFLNNYTIDLGTTGSLGGETNTKRITGRTGGYVQITQDLNAPSAVNPGNIGVEITSAANLGTTVIRRGHLQQAGVSVYRYFDITPAINSGLNATVNFYYFQNELGIISESNLGMFSSSNGGTSWTNIGENGIEQTLNYVTKNGIGQFDRLTLANISTPLAVSLLYLKVKLADHQTLLNWATATESGNDHFEIERSANGRDFVFLASVPGAGNSSSIQYYAYTDKNPIAGVNYYRLKQVDNNSHFTYSSVVMVNAGINQGQLMTVYPNPASGNIKLSFTLLKNQECLLQITDMSGKIIQSKAIRCIAGLNEMELSIAALPAGFYTISVAGSGLKSIPVLKK